MGINHDMLVLGFGRGKWESFVNLVKSSWKVHFERWQAEVWDGSYSSQASPVPKAGHKRDWWSHTPHARSQAQLNVTIFAPFIYRVSSLARQRAFPLVLFLLLSQALNVPVFWSSPETEALLLDSAKVYWDVGRHCGAGRKIIFESQGEEKRSENSHSGAEVLKGKFLVWAWKPEVS